MTVSELESKMIALMETKGKVNQNVIEDHFRSSFSDDQTWRTTLQEVMNNLLRTNRVVIYSTGGNNDLEYELQSTELAKKLSKLTSEEKQVLQEVRKGKNHGVWIRDLRYNTRLQKNRIEKILKRLTIVGLIKSVKSIASMNRRLYMLRDTVPAREISGGPWYTESEFVSEETVSCINKLLTNSANAFFFLFLLQDEGFIGSLRTAIEQIMKAHTKQFSGDMTSVAIHEQLMRHNVTETKLSVEHIEEILNTLVYDGKIVEVDQYGKAKSLNAVLDTKSNTNKRYYKMVKHTAAINSWTNKYGQCYAQDSDYSNAFGRKRHMILFCSCGCGMSSGCGVASLSTTAYHERVQASHQSPPLKINGNNVHDDDENYL
jgi:hypothetical protein